MNHAFIVTSAINSKFGVYTPAQRLEQTLATIASVRSRVPGVKIIVTEICGEPLTADQESALDAAADILIDFTGDAEVKAIYQSDNWDVVKSTTEVMCFARALKMCLADGDLVGVDRVHKISGRYLLNDNFDLSRYNQLSNRIVTTRKHKSQFPLTVTGVELQYMSRLWSWPADITETIIDVYAKGLTYIASRVSDGGYCDIEHMLYKYLPSDLVTEVYPIGLEGAIAPNGAAVKE
jgi:hypothetical protein